MKKVRLSITAGLLSCAKAVLIVAAITAVLLLIGRHALSEAVIALLYLVPVGWSAVRWGLAPSICAGAAALLAFDYFFIPPFHTLVVGGLQGWQALGVFLAVATVVVGLIQASLSQARACEREATWMQELSAALAGLCTQEAVASTIAGHLQQISQAALVRVVLQPGKQAELVGVGAPPDGMAEGRADLVLPIQAARGPVGEIQLWRGGTRLPPEDNRLLQNFATQAALALERARLAEAH